MSCCPKPDQSNLRLLWLSARIHKCSIFVRFPHKIVHSNINVYKSCSEYAGEVKVIMMLLVCTFLEIM